MRSNQDAATSPEMLAAQYADGANLRSRVSIYDYLERVGEAPAALESWVLDHVAWQASMTAADVGCGPGPYLAELTERAARVVALDLSPGMLRAARNHAARNHAARNHAARNHAARNHAAASRPLSMVVADVQELPLPDASMDVVLAGHMLYHVADIDAAVAEFRRVLVPGGTLLVVLNGADDKSEIRTVWHDAALSVSEGNSDVAFDPPHWGDRANLDNVPTMLGADFPSVTVDRLRGASASRPPRHPSRGSRASDREPNTSWAMPTGRPSTPASGRGSTRSSPATASSA